MIWLNETNGADKVELEYGKKCLKFKGHINGAIMGSAYGGSVEAFAKLWKGRGTIYGFDTFEDLHPGHLADDTASFEAICMDHWYHEDRFGKDKLRIEYQREELDSQGLDNAILIKGEVHKDSCKDIDKLHYVFLDMDIPQSMRNGYLAVKDRIVKGGYLLLHDIQNIKSVRDWYEAEVDQSLWTKSKKSYDGNLLTVLKRK